MPQRIQNEPKKVLVIPISVPRSTDKARHIKQMLIKTLFVRRRTAERFAETAFRLFTAPFTFNRITSERII